MMRNLVTYERTDKHERRRQLQDLLRDWSIYGDYDMLDAWVEYHNHGTLPFKGGWLEQPKWARNALQTLNMVYNLHTYERDIPSLRELPSSPFRYELRDNHENGHS